VNPGVEALNTRRYNRVLSIMLVILVGVSTRAPFLTTTCGSDVVQFAGFADTFLRYGFRFYEYNYYGAPGSTWPYPWRYIYGPILLYILAPLRLLVPDPVKVETYPSLNIYAPPLWCGAVKAVFTVFDILVAIVILLVAGEILSAGSIGSLAASLIYLLNPMTIYISSIYGMFDNIALFLFLLGVYLYSSRRRMVPGLLLLGLSISAKQTIFPAVLLATIHVLRESRGWRSILFRLACISVGVVAPFIPFLIASPGSITLLIQAFTETTRPGFTEPVVYSFNGLSSLITYMHSSEYLWVIEYWWIPFTASLVLTILAYYRSSDYLLSSFTAYASFTAFYWRVNHQYLVPLVAFTSLLLVSRLRAPMRILSLFINAWIGLWPIAFPTSWWAHVHLENPDVNMWKLLDSITLMIFDQEFYVAYSLVLTVSLYIYVAYSIILLVKRRGIVYPVEGVESSRSAAAGI